jgi:ankyrin repeat protein
MRVRPSYSIVVMGLTVASVYAEDSPEVARQKAARKAQDALIAAARQGDMLALVPLLQQGTAVNVRDGSQRTPLILAVRGGHLPAVRALIAAKADLDLRDLDNRTALIEAARRKDSRAALDLVAAGADVNLADRGGWTALMHAAKEGTVASARQIIRSKKQSSLDAMAPDKTSALSIAAERGRTALVRLLIEAGVAVRKPEIGGRALQRAAEEDHADVVVALMEARAPLGFATWEGEPPLHAAAARGQQAVVEVLLEGGVDPDQADRSGQTALIKAAGGGHALAVASLLRLGASPDLPDRDDWAPLAHAAAHSSTGSMGTIRDLVRAGANVDRRIGKDGKTALMIAAEKGNELAVDELIRSGASLDLRSGGKRALDLAVAEGHKRCALKLGGTGKE